MRPLPILAAAFAVLFVLMLAAGLESLRQVARIYDETSTVHEAHHKTQRALARIEANIFQSGVLVRDFLLDPSHVRADYYRDKLRQLRAATDDQVERLPLPAAVQRSGGPAQLRQEIAAYWDTLDPLFTWTPQQKLALSSFFLHQTVLPRREAVDRLTRELEAITKEDLAGREHEIEASEGRSRVWLQRLFAAALSLALLVAAASLVRISILEKRAAHERRRIEEAERELRRLSQQLVRAQEEERKALSRELHDQVGQMLTALRVEMGNLERLRSGSEETFRAHLREVKRLAEESLRTVRDLAMGLRPSMLDDLGLGPALGWQAREYSRRHGVPVALQLEGSIDSLPDGHRTCVYRVVQEALTNIARHAAATEIRVAVHCARDRAFLTVQDNGTGFDVSASQRKGLGLLSIQERVRELGGTVTWTSQLRRGTMLSAEIPVPQPAPAAQEMHA